MSAQTNKFLGTEKISTLIRKFALPCIFSLLVSALYNIVDQIFIGHSELGYLGNAATSIVFPVTLIGSAFAWCFGDGVTALMSIRQGQKKTKEIPHAIANSALIALIVGVIYVALTFIFCDQILTAFGASDQTLPLASQYYKIILITTIPVMVQGATSSTIRADGDASWSMKANIAGTIINVILDPLFIFGFGWGITGAALATIIGQAVCAAIIAYYFVKKTKTFKFHLSDFKLDWKIIADFTKLGVSTLITEIAIVVISYVCNSTLAKYGATSEYGSDIPIAVIGIAMKVFSIVINIIVGLACGAQPVLGYNLGAEKFDRIREAYKIIFVVTIITCLIATVCFELFPSAIVSIFGSGDALYMDFAVKTFRIFMLLITFTGLIKMSAIFFQSVGQPLKATVVSLARDIVFFVPLCYILPHYLGVTGVLWAAPVADAIGIILALVLSKQYFKTLPTAAASVTSAQAIIESRPGVIITIAREHGSAGKQIGKLVAEKLKIPFYYKEVIALAAEQSGLSKNYLDKLNNKDESSLAHSLYLTTAPAAYAIEAQRQAVREVAKHGSCVIIGRAADHFLKNEKNILRIYISAPTSYRIKKLGEMYGDTPAEAQKSIKKSDRNRASYYKAVSGHEWGQRENYDLCIDSSIGEEATAKLIIDYVNKLSAE